MVINSNVRFGSNARVHAGVNIGAFGKIDEEQRAKTPCFGDNVYVGPGAKVFGPICIGDNVAIGAGAVVYRSVPSNCTVVGTSMRVMEGKGVGRHAEVWRSDEMHARICGRKVDQFIWGPGIRRLLNTEERTLASKLAKFER